jgi:bifunctional non-homologous end joining protein LigD
MLAELSSRPAFTDSNWIFEIKWDGYRAIAELNGKEPNRLYSRKGTSFAKAFPKVYYELNKFKTPAVVDGEIVVFDENGKPSFQLLQNYNAKQKFAMQYQVFDVLRYKGKDLCKLPLSERKELLKTIVPESPIIRYCDHVETEGELFFDQIVTLDMEGMIAKKANSRYSPGERSKDWLKIKNHKFDEFVIVGFLHSDSEQYLKSLVIGGFENGKVEYRGCVSGFSDRTVKEIRKLLNKDIVNIKPVANHERFDAPVSWVTPKHLCNVRYTEITSDGILRHPVFQGLKKE